MKPTSIELLCSAKLQELGHRELEFAFSPEEALELLESAYLEELRRVRELMAVPSTNLVNPKDQVAHYPVLVIALADDTPLVDVTTWAYGSLRRGPGFYRTTITHPDENREYLLEQLKLLHTAHGVNFIVGLSNSPYDQIPAEFIVEDASAEATLLFGRRRSELIADSNEQPEGFFPLSLFSALQIDEYRKRLEYYTQTPASDFQPFVFLTNYAMHVGEFLNQAKILCGQDPSRYQLVLPKSELSQFDLRRILEEAIQFAQSSDESNISATMPRDLIKEFLDQKRAGQMPAYHLLDRDGPGITFINIGVGPSNAMTMVELLARLRPYCIVMLGLCGGLMPNQRVGMYIMPESYFRRDGTYDRLVPLDTAILPVAEIQRDLRQSIEQVCLEEHPERPEADHESWLRSLIQTGTVATVAERLTEIDPDPLLREQIANSLAIAQDMESATIGAGCHRWKMPFGACLIVSDLPYRGVPKTEVNARKLYRTNVALQVKVAFRLWELRRKEPLEMQSRKVSGMHRVPFR